jgi:uncharacterized HAD superfamily protein
LINYRSIDDLNRTIVANLYRLPRDVDVVIGIPRSGLLAASIVALALNVPLADLDGFLEGRVFPSGSTRRNPDGSGKSGPVRKVLVIEDSVHTGNSVREAKAKIAKANLPVEFVFCCVFGQETSAELVDILLDVVPQPRIYQWNLMHHTIMSSACLDIDGVLCRDPTEEENDDGPAYAEFLDRTQPMFLPSWPVAYLVTSRLEKYRPQTEAWLKKHDIVYDRLVMLDLPSAEERRRLGNHAQFKGEFYRSSKAVLFIESERHQAVEIARIAGKPVLCMETGVLIEPNALSPITLVQNTRAWQDRVLKRTARALLGPTYYETLKRVAKGSRFAGKFNAGSKRT